MPTERIKRELIYDMPAAVYHAMSGRPYVTSHLLIAFMDRGIQGYIDAMEGFKPNKAMRFGTAFHQRIESPNRYQETSHGLDTKERELIEKMASAVASNQVASQLMESGKHEVCMRGTLYGMPCQSLVDWISKDGAILDIKTMMHVGGIKLQIVAWKYDIQAAFYRALYREVSQTVAPCFILGVDKRTTPQAKVLKLSNDRLYEAECKIVSALGRLRNVFNKTTKTSNTEWPEVGQVVETLDEKQLRATPTSKKPNGTLPPKPRKAKR